MPVFTARRPIRFALIISAISLFASVVISTAVQYAAGKELSVVHFALATGMPLLLLSATAWPLIYVNAQLHAARRRLEHQARTDMLTNLPNRRAFFERAAEIFAEADRTGEPVATMMVDIDRFKAVNDTYGHNAGDAVLRTVAAALQSKVLDAAGPCEAMVARIGGEEFAVVLAGVGPDRIVEYAEAVCRRARELVCVTSGHRIGITVSVGVAMRMAGEDIDRTLRNADSLVYAVKRAGRDGWRMASCNPGGGEDRRSAA